MITEDSDGYDVPVSGILEKMVQQATLVGIRKILWNNGRKEVTAQ